MNEWGATADGGTHVCTRVDYTQGFCDHSFLYSYCLAHRYKVGVLRTSVEGLLDKDGRKYVRDQSMRCPELWNRMAYWTKEGLLELLSCSMRLLWLEEPWNKHGMQILLMTASHGWIHDWIFVSSLKFICWNHNPQYDGIRKWGLGSQIRSWGLRLYDWDESPNKKTQERPPLLLHHTSLFVCQHLNTELSSLQNFEK